MIPWQSHQTHNKSFLAINSGMGAFCVGSLHFGYDHFNFTVSDPLSSPVPTRLEVWRFCYDSAAIRWWKFGLLDLFLACHTSSIFVIRSKSTKPSINYRLSNVIYRNPTPLIEREIESSKFIYCRNNGLLDLWILIFNIMLFQQQRSSNDCVMVPRFRSSILLKARFHLGRQKGLISLN